MPSGYLFGNVTGSSGRIGGGLGTSTTGGSGGPPSGNRFLSGLGGANSNVGSWRSNWEKRATTFSQRGIDISRWQPVAQMDLQKILSGSYPMGNVEALSLVGALAGTDVLGNQAAKPGGGSGGGGWLGSIVNDVENIGAGLNPLNLAPKLYKEFVDASSLPETLTRDVLGNKIGGAVSAWENLVPLNPATYTSRLSPHEYQTAITATQKTGQQIDAKLKRGDIGGALALNFMQQPLLRDLPGAYTAGELAQGNWSELGQHPLMHFLDVLPMLVKASSIAARFGAEYEPAAEGGNRLVSGGEYFPEGSAREAFANNRLISGLLKSVGGEFDSPITDVGQKLLENANATGRKVSFPRTTEWARQKAHDYKIDATTQFLGRASINGQKAFNFARHLFDRRWAVLTEGWTKQEEVDFARAWMHNDMRSFVTSLPPERQDNAVLLTQFMQETAEELKSYLLASGKGEYIPDGRGNNFVYHRDDAPAKAFHVWSDAHTKAQQATDDLNRLNQSRTTVNRSTMRAAEKRWKTANQAALDARRSFEDALAAHPPQPYHAITQERALDELTHTVEMRVGHRAADALLREYGDDLSGKPVDEATIRKLQDLVNSGTTGIDHAVAIKQIMSLQARVIPPELEADWGRTVDDIASGWQEMYDQGIRPSYLPNPAGSAFESIIHQHPGLDRPDTAEILKKSNIYALEPSILPVAARFSWAQSTAALERIVDENIKSIFRNYGMTYQSVYDLTRRRVLAMDGVDALSNPRALDLRIDQEIEKNYKAFDEQLGRAGEAFHATRPNKNLHFVPTDLANTMDDLMKGFSQRGRFINAYVKGINAYRYAITFTPRHIVHINAMGSVMMMARQGPEAFSYIPRAWADARAYAKGALRPEELPLPFDIFQNLGWVTDDELRRYAVGHVLADVTKNEKFKTFKDAVEPAAKFANWVKHQEELMSDTYRISTYLFEHDKFMREHPNLSEEEARLYAVHEMLRTHMDFDGMLPIERTMQRYIFPFYGFTRQILRFMFQYPMDHPWRAAFITNAARMEEQDRQSGLPWTFNNYLGLGAPSGQGIETVLDTKSLNPFRSVEGQDPFTLAGWGAGLAPEVQAFERTLGINPLNLTVNTQQLQGFDPVTGDLVDVHHIQDYLSNLVGTVPQAEVLASLAGWSSALDYLKLQDQLNGTTSYREQLMSALGMSPFVPFDINLQAQRLRYEQHIYDAAKSAVSAAEQGNFGPSYQYDLLPFEGTVVTPQQLQQTIQQAGPGAQGLLPTTPGG